MNPVHFLAGLLILCLPCPSVLGEGPLVSSPGGILEEEVRQAQSRLTAMSHGFYSEAEWSRLFDHFAQLLQRAEDRGLNDLVIQLTSSQALVQAQALGQNMKAVELLQELLLRYRDVQKPELRRVYVQLADLYADLGDESAVLGLIAAYRNSNLHRPDAFLYDGGTQPGDPLQIARPHAHGEASLTLTAMDNAHQRARLASGRLAEDFTAESLSGRMVRLRDYRGQVVLLDFYHPQWPGWAESIPRLKKLYQRFRSRGFEIIAVPLADRAVYQKKLPWIHVRHSRDITGRYRVFGDAANFLIDQDGRIAGRNLTPEELQQQLSARLKLEL